ncbi:MAG: hypothetical protein ACKVUS_13880 [Saprospiraceae bacterium]
MKNIFLAAPMIQQEQATQTIGIVSVQIAAQNSWIRCPVALRFRCLHPFETAVYFYVLVDVKGFVIAPAPAVRNRWKISPRRNPDFISLCGRINDGVQIVRGV